MIMHHSQAVEMTDLMRARTTTKPFSDWQAHQYLADDEIRYMKQWLEDRRKPTSMPMDMKGMGDMKGMKHEMDMSSMP